jgi:hypothetical protein
LSQGISFDGDANVIGSASSSFGKRTQPSREATERAGAIVRTKLLTVSPQSQPSDREKREGKAIGDALTNASIRVASEIDTARVKFLRKQKNTRRRSQVPFLLLFRPTHLAHPASQQEDGGEEGDPEKDGDCGEHGNPLPKDATGQRLPKQSKQQVLENVG